ncbi:Glu/Leu/Phe/Val dehydrogenase [Patescibacteria group bacterium]|nr:Glu/Leu/Phe/Val dehydrogenase [Patescibacteria group bacterium]MBU4512490.1 Glu/Leu/Phe/Val dehydrogenase [Patescibacteria group bacterium]MCG2692804.1 Glu/Leu/Phe/Val dehydrogenase [Candidatus Parcubacteria bacterium]
MNNTFDSILKRLKILQPLMNLTDDQVKLLTTHKKISQAELEVNGEKYPAWRIMHNDALGPGKGGIRFHPEVSEDEIKCLSFWMSLKNALVGLPFGGAKGGVRFNPKEKNKDELEQISRAYIDAFYKVLGETKDIPAPDVYTNEQVIAWMLDEYEKKVGYHEPGMITGKPVEIGGSPMRKEATAQGGFIIIEQAIKAFGGDKNNFSIAIQGFGNVGLNLAKMLYGAGFKIVSVSDSQAGIFNPKGLDINQVIAVKEDKGRVAEYPEAEKISNQELLGLEVDLLVLAALENQITEENVSRVKAKKIIEVANGPITSEADAVLKEKDILVIPDILANAGGVVASFFEWTQNRTGGICPPEHLKKKLEFMMKDSWNRVYTLFQENDENIDLRTVAWTVAIERILAAEKWRGHLK